MTNDALFWQILKDRSSVRRFKTDRIPQDLLDKLAEAAKLAPVAGGNRNITVQIFDDPEYIASVANGVREECDKIISTIPNPDVRRETLAYSSNFSWFGKAPALIAVSCRKTPSYMSMILPKDTDDLFGAKASAAMAVQNILLAATVLGLGACCLTGPLFAKKWLEKELKSPPQNTLTFLVPVGFPARGLKDSSDAPLNGE